MGHFWHSQQQTKWKQYNTLRWCDNQTWLKEAMKWDEGWIHVLTRTLNLNQSTAKCNKTDFWLGEYCQSYSLSTECSKKRSFHSMRMRKHLNLNIIWIGSQLWIYATMHHSAIYSQLKTITTITFCVSEIISHFPLTTMVKLGFELRVCLKHVFQLFFTEFLQGIIAFICEVFSLKCLCIVGFSLFSRFQSTMNNCFRNNPKQN